MVILEVGNSRVPENETGEELRHRSGRPLCHPKETGFYSEVSDNHEEYLGGSTNRNDTDRKRRV